MTMVGVRNNAMSITVTILMERTANCLAFFFRKEIKALCIFKYILKSF